MRGLNVETEADILRPPAPPETCSSYLRIDRAITQHAQHITHQNQQPTQTPTTQQLTAGPFATQERSVGAHDIRTPGLFVAELVP